MTVRHLLTHTSGIGETAHPWRVLGPDFGESVPPGAPVTPLADYYRQGLRVDAEPGTRWTYTNHGFATLGQVVADITGVAFADYLHTHIFQALGMFDTTMVSGEVSTRDRATGYTLGARGPVPVTHREMITAPASSAYSTAHDMTRYLAALLNGGRNDHGRILQSDTLATMFAPHYQPDPRIPGIGLGLFRGLVGDRSVVEHQGILPGFNAQMWLSPADRTGVLSLVTGGHRALLWLLTETSTLLHQVLGVQEPRIRTDVPHRPEVWPDICGSYRLPGSLTDVRARGMVGACCRGPDQRRSPRAACPDADPRTATRPATTPRRPRRPLGLPSRPHPVRPGHRTNPVRSRCPDRKTHNVFRPPPLDHGTPEAGVATTDASRGQPTVGHHPGRHWISSTDHSSPSFRQGSTGTSCSGGARFAPARIDDPTVSRGRQRREGMATECFRPFELRSPQAPEGPRQRNVSMPLGGR